MANMLAAFLECTVDSHDIFDRLAIAGSPNYRRHLNQYNVIFINCSKIPRECNRYEQYIRRIQNGINRNLTAAFPDMEIDIDGTVWNTFSDIFEKTGQKFVFVIDEWDALVLMVSGMRVRAKMLEYAATSNDLNTRNQIYSAMVIYGLLTYDSATGQVFIPNKELMDQFNELLLSKDSLGYVYRLARKSEKMLEATLSGDTQTMSDILQYAHNTESPIFAYNSEIELSAVVNLVYLAARDHYRVKREDQTGKGYVDFIFYPEHKNDDGIILKLKAGNTPEEAIRQIKEKDYALRLNEYSG